MTESVAAHPFDPRCRSPAHLGDALLGAGRTGSRLSLRRPRGGGQGDRGAPFAALLVWQVHDGDCSSCRRAASGNHPDVNIVEPEGRTMLTVGQARTTMAQGDTGARRVRSERSSCSTRLG